MLRYLPPYEVPLPSLLQETSDLVSMHSRIEENNAGNPKGIIRTNKENGHYFQDGTPGDDYLEASAEHPLLLKVEVQGNDGAPVFLVYNFF